MRGRSRRPFAWPFALGLVGVGVLAAAVRHRAWPDFDEAGFVRSADGLRLRYEIEGEGPPLVLLAGGPGISHHGLHPYVRSLRHAARLIYFDPRGRGDSEEAVRYRVANDVRDLAALRSALGLRRFDLLGVSYGAHLAVAFAAENPQAVGKLVLVAPIVGASAWRGHLRALAEAPRMEQTLARIRQERGEVRLVNRDSMAQVVKTLLPLYWCEGRAPWRATSVFRPRHHFSRQNPRVYEDIVGRPFPELNGDLAASTLEHRLAEIRPPTLILHGTCDRVAPADAILDMEKAMPGARRVVFPRSGHLPFADEPRLFAAEVGRFLGEP